MTDLNDLFKQQRAAQANLATTALTTWGGAPDAYAEVLATQRRTQVAPHVALMSPQAALDQTNRRLTELALFDADETPRWIAEHPANAALVSDEVPRLIDIEKTFRDIYRANSPGRFGVAARDTWYQMKTMFRGLQGNVQTTNAARVERRLDLYTDAAIMLAETGSLDYAELGLVGDYEGINTQMELDRFAAMTPEARAEKIAEIGREYIALEENRDKIEAILTQYASEQASYSQGYVRQASDIRSLRDFYDWAVTSGIPAASTIAAFIAVGYFTGGTGVVALGTAMETGASSAEAIRERGAGGFTADDAVRHQFLGMLSGASEIFLGPVARTTGGGLRRAVTGRMRSALSRDVERRIVQGYARRIGRHIVGNAGEEFTQEAFQELLSEMAVQGDDFEFNDEVALAMFNAGAVGALSGGLVGGGIGVRANVQMETLARQQRDAGRTLQTLEEIDAVTADLKLVSRSSAKFREWASRLGLDNMRVFYQAEVVREYISSNRLTESVVLEQMGITKADYEAALKSGSRVSASAAGVVEALRTGPAPEYIKQNASLTPDGLTPAAMKEVQALRDDILQQIEREQKIGNLRPDRQEVVDQVKAQLMAAGVKDAEAEAGAMVAAAGFEALAKAYGGEDASGADLYKRMGFDVRPPDVDTTPDLVDTAEGGTADDGYRTLTASGRPGGVSPAGVAMGQRAADDRGPGRAGRPATADERVGGVAPTTVYEFDDGRHVYEITDPAAFQQALLTALAGSPVAAQVGTDPGDRQFLLDDGASGFALDGDNIISVFSDADRAPAGAGARIMEAAAAQGGRRLDGFDTYLPKIYARAGFRAVARLPFDPAYAPSVETGAAANWDYETFAAYNNGLPDVVFMVYDPTDASQTTDVVVEDYDAGVAAQMAALDGRTLDQADSAGRSTPAPKKGYYIWADDRGSVLAFEDYPGVSNEISEEIANRLEGIPGLSVYRGASNQSSSTYVEVVYEDESDPDAEVLEFKLRVSDHGDRHGSDYTVRFEDVAEGVYDDGEYVETTISHDDFWDLVNEGLGRILDGVGLSKESVGAVFTEAFGGRTLDQSGVKTSTDTQEFKAWFGDSKVVDENGDPLMVYHGTTADLTRKNFRFRSDLIGASHDSGHYGRGFYFASTKGEARYYGPNVGEFHLSIQNPLDLTNTTGDLTFSGHFKSFAPKLASIGVLSEDQSRALAAMLAVDTYVAENATFNAAVGRDGSEGVFAKVANPAEGYTDEIATQPDYRGNYPETREAALEDLQHVVRAEMERFHRDTFPGLGDEAASLSDYVRTELGSEALTEAAVAAGYDGIIYGDEYIAFEPTQIKSVNNRGTFDPADPRIMYQGPRGRIRLPEGGLAQGRAIISLMKGADKSTFIHETGHYFLELFQTLATDTAAPTQLRADYAAVNAWLGRAETDASPFTTAQHEQWATGFETYLWEGKSPSLALRRVFQRFKDWLTSLYRRIGAPGTELSPEVREVMDRMLATEEEVQLAKAEEAMGPMLLERPAGMPEMDYETYRRLAIDHDDEAEQTLFRKAMAAVKRRQTKVYKDARKALVAEETERLRQQQVYRLIDRLVEKDGEVRLNKAELEERFPEAFAKLKATRHGTRQVYAADGLPLDDVAQMSGYKSAVEMVNALADAPRILTAAESYAEDEIQKQYPDLLTDGSMRDEAQAAIHSTARGRLLAMEESEIRRQIEEAGGAVPAPMSLELLRATAKDMIQGMQVGTAHTPETFLRAEREAGRAAEKAFARVARQAEGAPLKTTALQDLMEAHAAKRRQRLSSLLYTESRAVRDLEGKIKRKARQLGRAATRKRVADPYLSQIYRLLEQYDFRQLGPKQTRQKHALAQLLDDLERQGRIAEAAISPRMQAKTKAQHYSTLTVEELGDLYDTILNLEHLGSTDMRALVGAREATFAEVKRDLMTSIDANLDNNPPPVLAREQKSRTASQALNSLFTADTLVAQLDGNKKGDLGYAWQVIKAPLSAAQARIASRKADARAAIAKLFEDRYGTDVSSLGSRTIRVSQLGLDMTKAELLAVALNTGNIDNWARLTTGDGALGSAGNVKAALLEHLDANDWRFVQGMWDYINSYWPAIAAQEKKLTGVVPKKVAAAPQVTPYAFVTGGYYPIKYDARLSGNVTEYDVNETLKQLQIGRGTKPQTRHGHVQERAASVDKPLTIDLAVAVRHVNDVITDLELREPVQQVWRLLNDPDISKLMRNKGLDGTRTALELWVGDVVNGDRWAAGGFNVLMRHLRSGLSIAKMGFSVTTLIQQPLGLAQSMVVVGKADMAKALWKWKSNPSRYSQAAQQISPFMKERVDTFQRDMMLIQGALDEDPVISKMSAFRRTLTTAAFWAIQKSQYHLVDVPTWMAVYDRELARGTPSDKAVLIADQMVARAQGSGLLSDRSAFERGTLGSDQRNNEFARLFTAFGSYMMAKMNVAAQQIRGTDFRSPSDVLSLTMDLVMLYGVEAMGSILLTGRWPDFDEEDEDPEFWVAKQTVYAIMAGFPVLRDVASAAEGFGGGGAYGSSVESLVKLWGGAATTGAIALGLEDEKRLRTALRGVNSGVGVLLHLPTIQLDRAMTALFERDMKLRDDFELWDLAFGRRE